MVLLLYVLAFISLAVGSAGIYMAIIKPFPVRWLYYHYFIRKPLVWSFFLGSIILAVWTAYQKNFFAPSILLPLCLSGLGVIFAYKMHQENAFKAVDFPAMADNVFNLPLNDDMQLGVIDYGGVTKAYPLDYVIHHHVVNDRFGDSIVALTYCAMCRSIIPFDVTAIGPLFVGSFKDANMIVADRKTKTFFQQATFQSIIGKLHPYTLSMIPFRTLSWSEVKKMKPVPQIAKVTKKDFREFQLPVPGIWKKIIASEVTPGLPQKDRDKTFPARTYVVGVIDNNIREHVVYLKDDLMKNSVVKNAEQGVVFIALKNSVIAFKSSANETPLDLTLYSDMTILDQLSGTIWNIQGKYIQGKLKADLTPVALSDEYWFSWKKFHPDSKLIRLEGRKS